MVPTKEIFCSASSPFFAKVIQPDQSKQSANVFEDQSRGISFFC